MLYKNHNKKAEVLTKKPWFSEPNLGGYVSEELVEALSLEISKSSHWSKGFHPSSGYVEKFEKNFSETFGFTHSVAVSNNGVGFDLVLRFLNLSSKDEAIIPCLNFKAWHMALLDKKVKIKLCDVEFNTLNMSAKTIEPLINKNTKLICLTHYSGLQCENDNIIKLIRNYEKKFKTKIWIIEDCARGIGFSLKPKLNTDASVYSFHSAKLLSTLGEGGMVTTSNYSLAKSVKNWRNYGGESDWGLNYKLSPIQAFSGIILLKSFKKNLTTRKSVGKKWIASFDKYKMDLVIPEPFRTSENLFYIFPFVLPKTQINDQKNLINIMETKFKLICGKPKLVNKRWKYLRNIDKHANLPNSIEAEKRYIYLPFHFQYKDLEMFHVFECLQDSLVRLNQ